MIVKPALCAFAILGCLIAPAIADDTSIPDGSAEHMKVFSPLLAGMAGGAKCNKTIDRQVAAAYVRKELSDATTFNVDQVVFLTWMAYAQQAMQDELGLPKKANKAYCGSLMKAFGPSGTQIAGLLAD